VPGCAVKAGRGGARSRAEQATAGAIQIEYSRSPSLDLFECL
jgi:hypothetical protein